MKIFFDSVEELKDAFERMDAGKVKLRQISNWQKPGQRKFLNISNLRKIDPLDCTLYEEKDRQDHYESLQENGFLMNAWDQFDPLFLGNFLNNIIVSPDGCSAVFSNADNRLLKMKTRSVN